MRDPGRVASPPAGSPAGDGRDGAAAGKALANAGLTAADIDLVVVATCTSVDRSPNVACRVAAKLGITAPAAYDINTACSGFAYALGTVDHAIRAGAARNAIVVGATVRLDRLDRPRDLHHLRRRAGAVGHRDRRRRAAGYQSRPGFGAGEGRRDPDRGLARVHPAGGAGGVPLGHDLPRAARAAGV
jgi:3-oxoacyl-(acyl-carrier-protein) synthase